jgi:NADPH-dependent curcumin reductase CurA
MMPSAKDQAVVLLARYPEGMPQPSDFALAREAIPTPAADQVMLRTLYLSLDPYLRPLLAGRHLGQRPELGAVMPGQAVAEVIECPSGILPIGSHVVAETGWREYTCVPVHGLRALGAEVQPLSTALGVLGLPGLTAWAGMGYIAAPKAGDTVLVSSAAGAVGSVAGQLAQLAGARVVGIVGSAQKQRIVMEEFGFDACVNYRSDDFSASLRAACPEGIDVYFDNVGGAVLEAALGLLRRHARIVLCGLMDQYNRDSRPPGPNLGPVIAARARMQGLVVYDYLDRIDMFRTEIASLLHAGKLRYRETISEGLAGTPAAFAALMRGDNLGKALVRVGA